MATYNLKYYLEYINLGDILNRVEIYQYSDTVFTPVSLEGSSTPVYFDKIDSDDPQEAIQGSSLTLSLLATTDNTFDDLFQENETAFLVKYFRSGLLKWQGFIIPDGSEQSWVESPYEIKLDCVDGLGLLKNLGFLDETTRFNFTGLMTVKDIIINCLRRTKIPNMNVNIHVDIFYAGSLPGFGSNPTNIDSLAITKLNTERFYPTNSSDPMNCEDVLRSTLELFKASITQRNGEWYIYKSNQIASNQGVVWRRYNNLGVRLPDQAASNLKVTIKTFTGLEDLHHCGANQKLFYEKAYKKLTINYKFGTVLSLNQNSEFQDWPGLFPTGWNKSPGLNIYKDQGYLGVSGFYNKNNYLESAPFSVGVGDVLKYEMIMRMQNSSIDGVSQHKWSIVLYQTGSTNYYRLSYNINGDGGIFWELNGTYINSYIHKDGDLTLNWTSPQVPVSGTVKIELYADNNGWPIIFKKASLTPGTTSEQPVKGEFHTVTQTGGFSFVPDNKEVFNGDGISNIFIGTIYKANGEPTEAWHRFGFVESKPLLQISAEDTLRMFQRQRKKFTGSFFGYFDYFSVIEIDGISGLFIATGITYDTASNQGDATFKEIINTEMTGVQYVVTDDYGEAIKPVIR